MASNSALTVSSLDFSGIKSDFITYLQGQSQYKDFNFEGSNLNALLDVMSYNTWLNSFFVNMAISEMFLDTSQTLDSAVSHAKELNYLPRSYKSAEALVNISIAPTADSFGNYPTQIILPKGTGFITSIDNKVYNFCLASTLTITSNGTYSAVNVPIFEGSYVTESFLVTGDSTQKFVISNPTVDTDSITVSVKDSSTSSNTTDYIYASSLFGVGATSKVYFLQGSQNGKYELLFGDSVFGVSPVNGNIVNVTYRVSTGTGANGANAFKPSSTYLGGYSSYYITTVSPASGGDSAESLASIKFRAPRHYQTQERAVVAEDFKNILYEKYPEIRALHVYGGEELYPPQYGKVIIAVDLKNVNGLPESKKTQFTDYIKTKMLSSITPVFISADYTYVKSVIAVKYNVNESTALPSDISALVFNTLNTYNINNLDDFNVTVRYSQIAAAIDNTDPTITGSDTNLYLIKKINPILGVNNSFAISFQNPVDVSSITSSAFVFGDNDTTCYLGDDGTGNLNIITNTNNSNIIVHSNVGIIDYTTGDISITNLNVSSYFGSGIKIYGTPTNKDFSSIGNTIIQLLTEDITCNVTAVRI